MFNELTNTISVRCSNLKIFNTIDKEIFRTLVYVYKTNQMFELSSKETEEI